MTFPGFNGFQMTATRRARGTASFSKSSCLMPASGAMLDKPVTLFPERARLAMNLAPIGSADVTITIGMVLVAFIAAAVPAELGQTITSTGMFASSFASAGRLSSVPLPNRSTSLTFLPSTYPSSRIPLRNSSSNGSGRGVRYPTLGALDCAGASVGQNTHALAKAAMNSRRLIGLLDTPINAPFMRGMSAWVGGRHSRMPSLNDRVGAQEQIAGHTDPERPGSLQIDHKLE